MSAPAASVVIPTLHGGECLERCLAALHFQTFRDFETIVVDNSGRGVVAPDAADTVIANDRNVGFGAAINQAIARSESDFIVTLNDDAYPEPAWLSELVAAARSSDRVGMCASKILLAEDPRILDSAGLNLYPDGTSKQRGHRRSAAAFDSPGEALMPSGCAGLYRRAMLDQVGAFDGDYFLYCEDSDLGLRGRVAGWLCLYAPAAVVVHDYSRSSGRASPLKASYVERNRLWTLIKVFPLPLWPLAPWFSLWRYLAHLRAALGGAGLAGEYRRALENPLSLVLIVWSAHWRTLAALASLWRKRRSLAGCRKLGAGGFWKLLRRHYVTAREIAAQ